MLRNLVSLKTNIKALENESWPVRDSVTEAEWKGIGVCTDNNKVIVILLSIQSPLY